MKKLILALFSISVFLLSCGEEVASAPLNIPLTIDGKSDDWKNIPVFFNEDMDVAYSVANNDSVFSLMLRFNDMRLARMISARGLTIWFDPDEGDQFAVRYKGFGSGGNPYNHNNSSGKFMPTGMFTVITDESGDFHPIQDFRDLKAAFSFDNGFYCLEYGIPMKSPHNFPVSYNFNKGKEVEVELMLGSLSQSGMMQGKGSGGGRGGGMSGGGMGGGGMGGRRGRGGGGMGGGMQSGGPSDVSITVILAGVKK